MAASDRIRTQIHETQRALDDNTDAIRTAYAVGAPEAKILELQRKQGELQQLQEVREQLLENALKQEAAAARRAMRAELEAEFRAIIAEADKLPALDKAIEQAAVRLREAVAARTGAYKAFGDRYRRFLKSADLSKHQRDALDSGPIARAANGVDDRQKVAATTMIDGIVRAAGGLLDWVEVGMYPPPKPETLSRATEAAVKRCTDLVDEQLAALAEAAP